MEEVIEFCAGLDVHRDTVVATVRFPQGRQRSSETKTFGTDTAELLALGDWLISHQVTRVGLESTGVYWKPVFYLLEDRIDQLWLLNAQHLKDVPGRKTDVGDSAWIARLVEHGLVRPSFVPPPPIRELRDFTRHRRVLSEERTRMVQRLEKVLQDAGIKLTSVASTVLSKSARAMLEAMLAGESDPVVLRSWPRAGCVRRSLRSPMRCAVASGFPSRGAGCFDSGARGFPGRAARRPRR